MIFFLYYKNRMFYEVNIFLITEVLSKETMSEKAIKNQLPAQIHV